MNGISNLTLILGVSREISVPLNQTLKQPTGKYIKEYKSVTRIVWKVAWQIPYRKSQNLQKYREQVKSAPSCILNIVKAVVCTCLAEEI